MSFSKYCNARGEELLFYVNQDLHCIVRYPMRQDFEILKLSKTNWLIIGTNKPPSQSDITFTSEIKNVLTFYWLTHDKILLTGDFNITLNNPNFNELIKDHELSNLISENKCFKSINHWQLSKKEKNSFYKYSNI